MGKIQAVIFDLDGTMTPGTVTVWLAGGYRFGDGKEKEHVEMFMENLFSQCEKEGPMEEVSRKKFEAFYNEHVSGRNNAMDRGDIAMFLTACGDEGIFPGNAQVVYARNLLLRGLSVGRIKEIAEGIKKNPGAEDVSGIIGGKKIKRILLSKGNGIYTDYHGRQFGMDMVRWCPTYIINSDGDPFGRDKNGRPNKSEIDIKKESFPYLGGDIYYNWDKFLLTGRVGKLKKEEAAIECLKELGIHPDDALAVDDYPKNLLKCRKGGIGLVVGYRNPRDPMAKDYRKDFKDAGIEFFEGNLKGLLKYVKIKKS